MGNCVINSWMRSSSTIEFLELSKQLIQALKTVVR